MLAIRQYIVGVNVGHDVGADDVFENFADYAGQRDSFEIVLNSCFDIFVNSMTIRSVLKLPKIA